MLEQFYSKEICPYCFEQFYLKNTPFRCASPPSRCAPEIDSIYADKWEDNRPIAKVLSSAGMFKRSVICSECKQHTHKRLCPECHMELPHTAGQLKNHIFAVIGAKEAGKSHYLAVLINQIKKQIGPSMDILLEPMNDKTIKRYRNDFYKPVYDDGDVIEATKSAYSDKNVQHPLIYSLTVSKKNLFGKSKIVKSVILVFFDTAGEDLDDSDTMSVVNKYIYRSNGIILLIDPLQLPMVRAQLSTSTALPDSNTDTADILNRTTRLIENGLNLKLNTQIKIPLAIAFSKFDAVLPLVDQQFQLHASANHEHGFDVDDFEAINGEMVSLLDHWEGQEVIQHAKTRYAKHGFFGLSALGCNPQDTRKIPSVRPQRVEDPLLWLLAENGIIKKVEHK
ncbi:MAG: hypothetical protein HAW67_08095 [Endozoicomonadaceae bacterium]|nr:hypothetical protein [Endozoicomonadaceae bacterium]